MQFSAKSFALDSIFSSLIVVFRCDRTDASRFFRTRRSIARVNNAVIKKSLCPCIVLRSAGPPAIIMWKPR